MTCSDLRGRRVFHYAGHASFRSDEAMASALVGDGMNLRAADVLLEDLEMLDLAVLSGCETGRMDGGSGPLQDKDLDGFVRAFLVAGAANVVVSLWPIADDSTAEFMARFHERVANEPGRFATSQALAQTMREFAEHPRYGHPRHWAGFCLYGRG